MIEKIKTYIILSLSILLGVFVFMWYCASKTPKVEKEIRTEESKYWKTQYTELQQKHLQFIQKNVETMKTVTRLFDENGRLKSEVEKIETRDLTKIDTSKTSTSTSTVTEKGETIEKETIKYAVYQLELALGGDVDLNKFEFNLLSHAGVRYFWINNNMGSGVDYDWKRQYLRTDWITLRF